MAQVEAIADALLRDFSVGSKPTRSLIFKCATSTTYTWAADRDVFITSVSGSNAGSALDTAIVWKGDATNSPGFPTSGMILQNQTIWLNSVSTGGLLSPVQMNFKISAGEKISVYQTIAAGFEFTIILAG